MANYRNVKQQTNDNLFAQMARLKDLKLDVDAAAKVYESRRKQEL